MALPLPTLPALNLLGEPITAYDEVGSYTNGRWLKSAEPDRQIAGSKQPSEPEELAILKKGDVGDGAITVYTSEELFIADEGSATPVRQTFIRHDNDVYRVLTKAPWGIHAGHNIYVCVRYLERR